MPKTMQSFVYFLAASLSATSASIIITGVIDGPLPGGTPKAIEFFCPEAIESLSSYGFGVANNGEGSDGLEYSFTGSCDAGEFLYIASEATHFTSFFGFPPTDTTGSAIINGDDAVELFQGDTIIDTFGDINTDGTGEAWEYTDGWASRVIGTGPDGAVFDVGSWVMSGPNALDGEVDNGSASSPIPIGNFRTFPNLLISGVVDGPLPGGTPKAIEFYCSATIGDLSSFGFGVANNGGGTDGQEYTFAGSCEAGDFLYIASESTHFSSFFGFPPTDTTGSAIINGDDAVELFEGGAVIDTFGDIHTDGTGEAWEYTDGWAYRNSGTVPDGNLFDVQNWALSGTDALDGDVDNESAKIPFPIGSFSKQSPPATEFQPTMVITGVIDGPLPGGTPKAIEFFCQEKIESLSSYGVGVANNGKGSDGQEYSFTGSCDAGEFLYIASEATYFTSFFGFPPTDTTGSAIINGDDAVELFQGGTVIDTFGDINTDGTGEAWEYTDGWASRVIGTGPDGAVFDVGSWVMSGPNALDGEIDNGSASAPFPNGSFVKITKIHDIQGTGASSPMEGNEVTVEAIVVGDFQNQDGDTARNLGGFFLQEEDSDQDDNVLTSEGIFILEDSLTTFVDVALFDKVQVTGTVTESGDLTGIVASKVIILETGADVSVQSVILPFESAGDLERYEGMLVGFPQPLVISEMFQFGRFGEVTLAQGSRPFQFTQENEPSVSGYQAHVESLKKRLIVYDDGQIIQNPDPLDLFDNGPFTTLNAFRMGDITVELEGVVDFRFQRYRIHAARDVNTFTNANPRQDIPPSVGGDFKVVSLNVLNYFTTVDTTGVSTAVGLDPRGADTTTEFNRQTQKLVTAMLAMDADVFALVELENDFIPGSAGNAIEHLVGELNLATLSTTFDWVDPGTQFVDSSDAISVGIIYKPGAFSVSAVEILRDSNLPAGFTAPIFDGVGTNRASMKATFTSPSSSGCITVAVNHFRSKGGAFDSSNVDIGDGQANNNPMRLLAAQAVGAWVQEDVASGGCENVAILGDLNAYAKEDPITHLVENQGFHDLEQEFAGPTTSTPYSYVFGAQLGTLDYALANAALLPKVTGAATWHINADEASVLDYNLDFGRNSSIFDGNSPWRTSDHDPIMFGISFD